MDYVKVKIEIVEGNADELCAALSDIASGFEIDDPQVVEDFTSSKLVRWDYIDEGVYDNPSRNPVVCFYVSDDGQGREDIEAARAVIADIGGKYSLSVDSVRSDDWENNWKQYYKPFKIGSRLYLRPSWESIEDEEGRTVMVMDPASSFGTGSHATTRLCMEMLDGLELRRANVLDMGCGSGILGVCAMLLGAERLTACDIEAGAVKTAQENLIKNGITDNCAFVAGDVLENPKTPQKIASGGPYNIILANIVADVLKGMAGFFAEWLAPDGVLILSGIISERGEEVREYYKGQGFSILDSAESDGWVMLAVSAAE